MKPYKRHFTVRLFGYSLQIKDTTLWPLLFSQRHGYGYVKCLNVGKWWIGIRRV